MDTSPDNPLDNNSNPLQHQPCRPFPFWHSRIPFSCSQHSGHILKWTNKPKVLLARKTENPRLRLIPKPSAVLALVWLLCLEPHLDVWKLFDRQERDCRRGLKQGTPVKDKCKMICTLLTFKQYPSSIPFRPFCYGIFTNITSKFVITNKLTQ